MTAVTVMVVVMVIVVIAVTAIATVMMMVLLVVWAVRQCARAVVSDVENECGRGAHKWHNPDLAAILPTCECDQSPKIIAHA